MMQRILNSKNLVAFVLAAATGMTLYFRVPFPEGNIFLRVMALRSPSGFEVLNIGYSVLFSGLYIFALKAKQRIRVGKLPLFPDPRKRDDLFLVVGEGHNPRKQLPAENPQWLVIPERGLLTGVAILGAIGSPTTAPLTSMTLRITPATPSKKREPLSTRIGEMFNLSRKPQVIPLRSGSEAKGRRFRGDIVPVKQSEMNVV